MFWIVLIVIFAVPLYFAFYTRSKAEDYMIAKKNDDFKEEKAPVNKEKTKKLTMKELM